MSPSWNSLRAGAAGLKIRAELQGQSAFSTRVAMCFRVQLGAVGVGLGVRFEHPSFRALRPLRVDVGVFAKSSRLGQVVGELDLQGQFVLDDP